MSGRGYSIRCPQCKEFMARSHFGVRGGTHRLCVICRQNTAEALAKETKRILATRTQRYLTAEEKRKERQIKNIAKEFARVTYQNRHLLRKLHSNLNPTTTTLEGIARRTAAQEKWQVAHDVLIKRIEKGENIHSLQQYFEEEP